jgi:YidC/Oxa1 family membrane protein insertase
LTITDLSFGVGATPISPITNIFYTVVSWVLLRWHQLFTLLGMQSSGGLTWALSIIMLVVTARVLLFRFFIKQVHYQRHMQTMQPQMQKLREKYKGDRAGLQQEMMKLQQEQGFNPLAGCLPMFLQIPVFLSLFHVLRHLSNSVHTDSIHRLTLYGFSASETRSAARSVLFGGAPLAGSFRDSSSTIASLGGSASTTRIVAFILVVISAGATYLTQRQVAKNATTAPTGQAATIQKAMLYIIPLSVLGSGFIFPVGVLLYWFSSNLWTMGQQFYIFRFHPQTAPVVPVQSAIAKAAAPKPGAKPLTARERAAKTREVAPEVTNDASNGSAKVTGSKSAVVKSVGSQPSGIKPRSTASRSDSRPAPGARPPAKGNKSKKR